MTNIDANGIAIGMTNDPLNRLAWRAYPDGGIEHFGYSANFAGPTSYTNQIGNVYTYAYDSANRKTNETCVNGVSPRNMTVQVSFCSPRNKAGSA